MVLLAEKKLNHFIKLKMFITVFTSARQRILSPASPIQFMSLRSLPFKFNNSKTHKKLNMAVRPIGGVEV